MSGIEELERRLAALERKVAEEAGLRAAVDRDQSDHGASIKATHHLVQALAITQSDQTMRMERLEGKIDALTDASTRILMLLRTLVGRGEPGE